MDLWLAAQQAKNPVACSVGRLVRWWSSCVGSGTSSYFVSNKQNQNVFVFVRVYHFHGKARVDAAAAAARDTASFPDDSSKPEFPIGWTDFRDREDSEACKEQQSAAATATAAVTGYKWSRIFYGHTASAPSRAVA